MKIKTLFSVAIASLATSFTFADQGDVVVTFSTPGIDTYQDGTTVLDKEWYALCWSADGVFDGLKTDGAPVDPNDELILMAPLAKGGRCPFTAFEFPRNAKYDKGKFSIFLLDTRSSGGVPAATRAEVFVKGGEASATVISTKAAGGASVAWSTPTVLGQAQIDQLATATIKSFEVVGANVQITVEGAVPNNSCFVLRTGATVDAMNTYAITPEQDPTAKDATFIVSKDKGNFFSVGTLAK